MTDHPTEPHVFEHVETTIRQAGNLAIGLERALLEETGGLKDGDLTCALGTAVRRPIEDVQALYEGYHAPRVDQGKAPDSLPPMQPNQRA